MITFKEFVNEAYVNNEKTKEVREDLKKEFPDFKFSVRKRHYTTVDVAILSGPLDLTEGEERDYIQVNTHWIQDHYKDKPEIRDFLQRVTDIINKGNFDKSDIMTDYFHVGFYVSLSIGEWDRPYVKTEGGKKTKKAKSDDYMYMSGSPALGAVNVPKVDEVNPKFSDFYEEKPRELRSFENKK